MYKPPNRMRLILFLCCFSLSFLALAQSPPSDYTFKKEWKTVKALGYYDSTSLKQALSISKKVGAALANKSNANWREALEWKLIYIDLRAELAEEQDRFPLLKRLMGSAGQSIKQPTAKLLWKHLQGQLYSSHWQAFLDRRPSARAPLPSMQTMDSAFLYFDAIHAEAAYLKTIPLEKLTPFYPHTNKTSPIPLENAYAFLWHTELKIIQQLQSRIQTNPEQFEEIKLFATADIFQNLSLPQSDLTYRRFWLYQQGLKHHEKHSELWWYSEWARLEYAYQTGPILQRNEWLSTALQAHVDNESTPAQWRSLFLSQLAELARLRGQRAKALDLAKKGLALAPDSYGGVQCHNVKQKMELKQLSVAVETVNPPQEKLLANLCFNNLEKVELQLRRLSPEQWKAVHGPRLEYKPQQQIKLLRRCPLIEERSYALPSSNYEVESAPLVLPALPEGYYALLASDQKGLMGPRQGTAFSLFQVSALRQWEYNGKDSFVLQQVHIKTGAPAGKLRYLHYEKRLGRYGLFQQERYKWFLVDTLESDAQGRLVFPYSNNNWQEIVLLDDSLHFSQYFKRPASWGTKVPEEAQRFRITRYYKKLLELELRLGQSPLGSLSHHNLSTLQVQDSFLLRIDTRNDFGAPIAVKGSFLIRKAYTPAYFQRPRLWAQASIPLGDIDWASDFPSYKNPLQQPAPFEAIQMQGEWGNAAGKAQSIAAGDWEQGYYRLELEGQAAQEKTLRAERYFILQKAGQTGAVFLRGLDLQSFPSPLPYDTANIQWLAAKNHRRDSVFLEYTWLQGERVLERGWIRSAAERGELRYPLSEDIRQKRPADLKLQLRRMVDNRFHQEQVYLRLSPNESDQALNWYEEPPKAPLKNYRGSLALPHSRVVEGSKWNPAIRYQSRPMEQVPRWAFRFYHEGRGLPYTLPYPYVIEL